MQTMVQRNRLAETMADNHSGSRRGLWTGRVLGGLAVAFLIIDSVGKLVQAPPVVEATTQLGYPADAVFGIGLVLLVCVGLYLVPQTSALGAVLLTAYLGGAVATHVRVGSPLLTHVLFPAYLGALLWGSLVLRDARLRALLPWARSRQS